MPAKPAIPHPAGRNDSIASFVVCMFLAAAVWAAFGGTLRNGFVNFDDGAYVSDNPDVNHGLTLNGIIHAFTRAHADNWHPLTWISHMHDCQLYGLQPAGHHFTNVLIHAITAILLFLVLRQLTGSLWRCALAAAVFAVHPLRTESIAWIAERKDVLSGMFFMLTIAAYTRYTRQPSPLRYIFVAVSFALGLMCKPMLVTLPLVLLLLDYWPLDRWRNPRSTLRLLILEKLPLLGLAVISSAITFWAQTGAIKPFDQIPFSLRLGNALVSCAAYIGQMFWPSRLAVLYPFPSAGWPVWQVILATSWLILIMVAVVILRRSRPYLLTGWLWYLVMLGPVIGVFQVGAQARADRYTYLPQIGLYLLAVWAAADWCGTRHARRIAVTACSAIVLAGLIFSARAQTAYWRDSESLWTHALGVTSGNFIAHNNLGTALFQKGDLNGATNQYEAALQIRPDYEEAHFNLGTALLQGGDVEGAINEFQTALRLQPDHAQAHINLGSALAQKGDVRDAIAQIQSGLQLDPGNVEANNNLAWLLATSSEPSLRDGRRAVELAQQANRLAGDGNMSTLRTLAAADAEAGRFDDAVQNAQAALALAQTAGRSDLIEVLRNEINLYQARQPLREAGQ